MANARGNSFRTDLPARPSKPLTPREIERQAASMAEGMYYAAIEAISEDDGRKLLVRSAQMILAKYGDSRPREED